MFKPLIQEIDSMMARDPAARSRLEVVLCYPGFQAFAFHRLSRWLWRRKWTLAARLISQIARWLTGIEIHPGAQIGRNLFIDHGMGVVIGETSQLGDNVTLYHGVTLGGVSPSVDSHSQRDQKRHPTLSDGVIVGSGAQILGPITVGRCARVGANAVVTKDVPDCATVVGNPGKVIRINGEKPAEEPRFMAYGTPTGDIPDPVARALEGLLGEVQSLRARVNTLEAGGESAVSEDEPHEDEDGEEQAAKSPRGVSGQPEC
jgi:serine O-acetyltransferase